MMRVLVIGATSAIASAVARRYAAAGAELFLAARSGERLAELATTLRSAGAARVETAQFDASDLTGHDALVATAFGSLGTVDRVLVAHGTLPDQALCQADAAEALREFGVNALSVISVLTPIANRLEAQGFGRIAVIGSVAGDRGRQSNYLYGSAKAAVEAFVQGLGNRLHRASIGVLLVKPGFVSTPMTRGLKQNFLFASADRVGASIHRAMEANAAVLYTPWFWRVIMFIIRLIPESVFRRMRL